jgi:hypothetical protein
MTRTQILMPPQMLEWLRLEAARKGVAVSEVIRSLVQKEIDKK